MCSVCSFAGAEVDTFQHQFEFVYEEARGRFVSVPKALIARPQDAAKVNQMQSACSVGVAVLLAVAHKKGLKASVMCKSGRSHNPRAKPCQCTLPCQRHVGGVSR